jgi:hypothetical protein
MKPREGPLGYLALVTTVGARSDLLEAQLLNTFSAKRMGQWEQIWFDDHPDPKKRQPKPVSKGGECDEYRTPVSCKHSTQYKPWVETVAFAHFTPIALDLQPDAQGYLRIPRKFHGKHVCKKPNPRPKEPRAEHRDLSWYMPTLRSTPPPPTRSPAEGTPSAAATFDHAPVGRQTRQSTRKARLPAAVSHLHGPRNCGRPRQCCCGWMVLSSP